VRSAAGALAVAVVLAASGSAARAQPELPRPPPVAAHESLRERVGMDMAMRLLRSSDADDRLRGLERIAATHTPEALALLIRTCASASAGAIDPRLPMEGIARKDPRALLVAVRGLASWSDQESARSALANVLMAPPSALEARPPSTTAGSGDPTDDDAVGAARIALAREQAALALADSGSSLALEALVTAARREGFRRPALEALAIRPPPTAAPLGGVALTTPSMIALAVEIGDLRTLDSILGAVKSSDAGVRAAAIAALGSAADARAVEIARASTADRDARVRVAAAAALVRLGAPDAPRAVEALIADDATALDGLRLAEDIADEGVTRAAAARAAASPAALRSAAIAALGRQTSAAALQALSAMSADPAAGGEAACALARSPNPAAWTAIERLAAQPTTRRLALRAYFVRTMTRGERHPALHALVERLGAGSDPTDRALAVEIRVAAGEVPLDAALRDPDPRVRRGAILGAMALSGDPGRAARGSMLARWPAETDPATRVLLAVGLPGDSRGVVSNFDLEQRIRSGAPDAALAATALMERSGEDIEALATSLVRARDAVMRAHAARGLGASADPQAVGTLARAYDWEGDPGVRRAILSALASRGEAPSGGPARRTFELAARLDPDRLARWTAEQALSGRAWRTEEDGAAGGEVAWLELAAAPGAAPLAGETGLLILASGQGVPVAFDDDGYALVPGLPPGAARLRLAPRLPAYSALIP
jgi:HEAT repeat protein